MCSCFHRGHTFAACSSLSSYIVLFLQYLSYARPFVGKSDLVAALRSVRWTMRRSCKCSNACKKRKSIRQLRHVTRTLHRKLYMILETLLTDIERLETRETLETFSKLLRLRIMFSYGDTCLSRQHRVSGSSDACSIKCCR